MNKINLRNAILIRIACVCYVSTLLISCKQAPQTQPESEYAVLTATSTNCNTHDLYSATIRGKQDIDIYPQVSGNLTRLCVKEGEHVRKGQLLFVIDQVPYQAALTTAKANVSAAQAAVATAQLTVDSKRELYNKNIVSAYDLQTTENTLLNAKAGLAQAEAQELNARNSLSYTEVKSPSDGVVGTLPYRVGTLVNPSMPKPLTTVSDNSEMYVYFSMTEKQLLNLIRKYGSKEEALNSIPAVNLRLTDGSNYEQPGIIETISGIIDPNTGTVSLRAVFPNGGGILASGGSGNIVIPVTHENVITIPQKATFEVQHMTYIYKVIEGKAQSCVVEVSRVNGGQDYIVSNGLTEGDLIVAEGVGLLREGTPIKIKQD